MLTHATTDVDDGYKDFERLIHSRSQSIRFPTFRTNTTALYDHYLKMIDPHRQQHYQCRACREFVENYGNLVTVDESARRRTVFWDPDGVPPFFQNAVHELRDIVMNAPISGTFGEAGTIGRPMTGAWTHLYGEVVTSLKIPGVMTPSQVEARHREDRNLLLRTLGEYREQDCAKALAWLAQGKLWQAEKFAPTLHWFNIALQTWNRIKLIARRAADDYVWRLAVTAPTGWCHLRNGMVGTILDAVKSGAPYERFEKAWNAAVDPVRYRRPQAPPKAGNVARAEEIFKQMGLEPALRRRYAGLHEVPKVWEPAAGLQTVEGIFAHLLGRRGGNLERMPTRVMSWRLFARDILPTVKEMSVHVRDASLPFSVIVAPEDQHAPPLLQWDTVPRNPYSWYFYSNGSSPRNWNVLTGALRVIAVVNLPHMWYHKCTTQKEDAILVLSGCKDIAYKSGGLFFPQMLRSELKEVDSVLEAYSNAGVLSRPDCQLAAGLAVAKGCTLEVETVAGHSTIQIDRWE